MGQVIRGPWQGRPSNVRRLVESNLRQLNVHREREQALRDNLNRNVLAEAWRETPADQHAEVCSKEASVPVIWPLGD